MSAPSKITCNNGKGNKRIFNVSNAVAAPVAAAAVPVAAASSASASTSPPPATAPAAVANAVPDGSEKKKVAKQAAKDAIAAISAALGKIPATITVGTNANAAAQVKTINEQLTRFNQQLKTLGIEQEIAILNTALTTKDAINGAIANAMAEIKKLEPTVGAAPIEGGRRKRHGKTRGKRSMKRSMKHHKKHGKTCGKRSKTHRKRHGKHGKRSRKH